MNKEMMDFAMNGVDALLQMQRFLDDLNSTDSTIDGNSTNSTIDGNSTAAPDDNTATERESLILKGTFTTYGSAFVVVFFLLCVLRQKFPRAFNLRSWVEDIQCDLARQQYGFLSWTWQIWMIPDERLMDECGLDAACFQRVCALGIKLSMVGMVGALFLMPSYATAPKVQETTNVTDWVVMVTTANVGPGSPRLIATAVAAWVVFGLTMWLIVKEMEWITAMRHRFLRKRLARNYAVYVRNIPEVYQSSFALKRFFERSLGVELLEGNIAMKTMNLQKAIAQRAVIVSQLEHAIAEEESCGRRPTHKVDNVIIVPVPGIMGGETVDSIEYYAKQLKAKNKDITERINSLRGETDRDLMIRSFNSGDDDLSSSEEAEEETGFFSFVHSSARNVVSRVAENTTTVATGATGLVGSATTHAVNLLAGNDDGQIYSAGFVVFKKLSTVQRALRLTHYEKPYMMECLEAPDPDDIFWSNVGRQHKDLQIGKLFSVAATAVTCLFWTIPVSFVSSLSSVDALRTQVEGIDEMLTAAPFLVPVFEIFSPQLLVVLNNLLPIILTTFCRLEGPISGASVESSLFVKLSAFMIIQTFFVSAISGSIFEELNNLLEDPAGIVDFLATSLPARSTFFMQMAVVMTVTTSAIEGLRVVPLVLALLRRFVGPRLTEKERRTTYMGLAPLNEPPDFPHADFLSNMVLYFIIYLVYATIAPLVSFILALCFAVMGTLFRNQFVYIYKSTPDSGGLLFLNFIQILTSCLLIGELTVTGLLALKRSPVATPIMFPLLLCTFLFNYYIRQQHFTVAQHLPSRLCYKRDRKNENMDYSFLKEEYLQPELREPVVLPEISDDMIGDLRLLASDEDDVDEGNNIASEAVSCRVTRLRFSEHTDLGKDSERWVTDHTSLWEEQSSTSPDYSSRDYQLP